MKDPRLEMEFQTKKQGFRTESEAEAIADPFEVARMKLIDDYVETLDFDPKNPEFALQSPAAKKAQLKQELKESSNFSELNVQLERAFAVLSETGSNYLAPEVYDQMVDQFSMIGMNTENIDFQKAADKGLQAFFEIDDVVMNAVAEVALAKYEEEDYTSCLAIFALLSTLDSANFEYWYRLGIAAQRAGNFDLALRAYDVALELNPSLVGAKLFSIECYLRNNDTEKAKLSLKEAKELAKTADMEKEMIEFMRKAEQLLAA